MAMKPKGLLPTEQDDTQMRGPQPNMQETSADAKTTPGSINRDKVSFMYNRAMELAYERGFDQLMAMFKNATPQTTPRALSQAVVSMMDIAEQEAGEPATDEELMAVALLLVSQVYSDMVEAKVIQENDQMLYTAMARTITEWIDRHRDRVTPEMLKKMASAAPQVGQHMQRMAGGLMGGQQ